MAEADLPKAWKQGDPFSAAHLNESTGVTRRLSHQSKSGNVRQLSTPTGTHFHVMDDNRTLRLYLGLVVAAGPAGEVDFTDERYWVKIAYLVNVVATGSLSPAATFKADDTYIQQFGHPVVVTNLPEVPNHSHDLTTSGVLPVVAWLDYDDNGNPRWYMTGGGGSSLKYARFIAFAGDNVLTAHPCNVDGTSVDTATTIYLMMTFPAGTGNTPPFASFVPNVDVLGYFSIPAALSITVSGHVVSGVLESFTQWPFVSLVGQSPYCSVANTGPTAAMIIWDWPTLHPIP